MAADYELTFDDYWRIVKRRGWLLALVFVLLFAISAVVAVVLPPVFESTGTILVESQQVPTDLVAASITSFADERIEVIRQRVMTRENLLKIVDKYKLFGDAKISLSISEKIDSMREAMNIAMVTVNMKGKQQAAIAFKLTFEYRHPEIATRVANDLVTLFLDENAKQRNERAAETTEFLAQESTKLKAELEKVEEQLAAYKRQYGGALPQQQDLRMTMMARIETELKDVVREQRVTQEELRSLEVELAAAKAGVGSKFATQNPGGPTREPQDLDGLKAELVRLSSTYKDSHPDVRAVKRKIEALESAEGATPGKAAGSAVTIEVARVQTRIAAATARVESLGAQAGGLRTRMAQYEQQSLQAPEVERGLLVVMRDHENAQKKYAEIRAKQRSAQISENMEQENKAERFVLIEPPQLPEKPVKPNRKKIVALGFFMSLAGSGGLVALLELLNQRVRGSEALTAILRRRILVTIPYIPIQAELSRNQRRLWFLIIGLLVALSLAFAALHFLYMPLDILLMKMLARLE